ncbi:MAG: FtsW/RodA/SpoVE family cell cycle protein [Lachnospiraceae bacterium]
MKKYYFISLLLWLTMASLLIYGYIIQTETTVENEYLKIFIPVASVGMLASIFFVYRYSVYSIIKEKAPILYFAGIFVTMLLETSFGMHINGARRWLGVNHFRIIRPAIFLLLTMIFIMGYLLDKTKGRSTENGIFDTLIDWAFEEDKDEESRTDSELITELLIKLLYNNYKVIIPIGTTFLMIYYDDFIDSYLVVVVIALVFNLIFEKNVIKIIRRGVFWILFGIMCVHIADYSIIYNLKNGDVFGDSMITARIEKLQQVGMFGEGLGTSTLKTEGVDPFYIFVTETGKVGIAVLIILYLLLIFLVFYTFVLAKRNGDLFGMVATSCIGTHLASVLALSLLTNLAFLQVIVVPPFLPRNSFNILVYIFEVTIVQSVLLENIRIRETKEKAQEIVTNVIFIEDYKKTK